MTTPTGPVPQWISIHDAAVLVGRSERRVYEWLAKPKDTTGIRRLEVDGSTYVEQGSLLTYESGIRRGRPRKER